MIVKSLRKKRSGPKPDDLKTAIFCRNEKEQIIQTLLCTTTLNK